MNSNFTDNHIHNKTTLGVPVWCFNEFAEVAT